MSLDSQRAKIADHFITMLASSPYASAPVGFDNLPFETPDVAYFRVHNVPISGKRASIGTAARFQKHESLITVEVYVPENQGTKLALEMVEWAIGILEERSMMTSDGDRITLGTGSTKINGLQYGKYRITGLIPAIRRSCKP